MLRHDQRSSQEVGREGESAEFRALMRGKKAVDFEDFHQNEFIGCSIVPKLHGAGSDRVEKPVGANPQPFPGDLILSFHFKLMA